MCVGSNKNPGVTMSFICVGYFFSFLSIVSYTRRMHDIQIYILFFFSSQVFSKCRHLQVRCRKCKNGAKFFFCSIIHGSIELVELIKNISFLICFDHVLAEKFSKYLVHPKKWKKRCFRENLRFHLFTCFLTFWKEFILIQHQKVSMST